MHGRLTFFHAFINFMNRKQGKWRVRKEILRVQKFFPKEDGFEDGCFFKNGFTDVNKAIFNGLRN